MNSRLGNFVMTPILLIALVPGAFAATPVPSKSPDYAYGRLDDALCLTLETARREAAASKADWPNAVPSAIKKFRDELVNLHTRRVLSVIQIYRKYHFLELVAELREPLLYTQRAIQDCKDFPDTSAQWTREVVPAWAAFAQVAQDVKLHYRGPYYSRIRSRQDNFSQLYGDRDADAR